MSDTTHMRALPDEPAVDLHHVDAALLGLRRVGREIATTETAMMAAYDGLRAHPDDPEMRRAARLAGMRMRAAIAGLAHVLV